jgi:hypothetical protein
MTQPPEPTGEPRVDAALSRLSELADRPVEEHVEVYEDVHGRLRGALEAAAPPPDERRPDGAHPG